MMSAEVLDRIRDKCKAFRYYRAGIFCEDRSRARLIQETLLNAWSGTTGHHRLNGMDVDFPETGSFVRILTYAEVSTGAARGNRFHEICIDSSVVPITEQIRDVLNRMVVPYQYMDYRFDPYAGEPCFEHLGTRDSFIRGHRASGLIYDEFAGVDLDVKNISFGNGWLSFDQYEYTIKDGQIEIREKKAPDFGEFSPSQELNDFVNTLIQGE